MKDVRVGALNSAPANFFNHNSTLFFSADDGVNGRELWKSTAFGPGTLLAADINPGGGSLNPAFIASSVTTLFFAASDGASGTELWTLSNPLAPGGLQAITVPSSAGILPSSSAVSGLVFEPSRQTLAQWVELASPPRRISPVIRFALGQENVARPVFDIRNPPGPAASPVKRGTDRVIHSVQAQATFAQTILRDDFTLDSQFPYDELVVYFLRNRVSEFSKEN